VLEQDAEEDIWA